MKELVNCVLCGEETNCGQHENESFLAGAFALPKYVPDTLCGRLCQIIETAGLNDKQEEAIKKLVKETVWNQFGPDAVKLKGETYHRLLLAYKQEVKIAIQKESIAAEI